MTEYWKSNERKYCDFCKCWIADNKISVSLHEGGKRHKENVAKKITEINKKSFKEFKDKTKVEEEINLMEKNAMAAYLKDIESNADLTSQIINEKLAETDSKLTLKSDLNNPPKDTASGSSKKKTKWQQAKTDDGSIYYWNTETFDTVLEPPPEGFVSIADLSVTSKKSKPNEFQKKDKKVKESKSKVPTSSSNIKPPVPPPVSSMGPQPRAADPYGSWTVINPEPTVDLELPVQPCIPTVQAIKIEPEKKFKEKQMTTCNEPEYSGTEFKKRKINSNAKRNTRQRLDDD